MSHDEATWSSLPPELHHQIALRLQHTASLVNMRGTCASMRAAVNQEDVWQAARARHGWQQTHMPRPGLSAHAAFAEDVRDERKDYRQKSRDASSKLSAHAFRNRPIVGHHGGAVASGPSHPGQYAEINKLQRECAEIQAAFAAEGLRAKPYSLRQRLTRAVRETAGGIAAPPLHERPDSASADATASMLWDRWFYGKNR